MYQWENVIVQLTCRRLYKLLINTLTLIVFLVTSQHITNKSISGTINRIESVVTVERIGILNFFNTFLLTDTNLPVPLVFVEARHQNILIYFNSLALFRIKFLHILVWILSIHWIFIVLLLLHLVFPCTIFCHDRGTRNLHVINNKLICEERILFILACEVLDWNQHFSDLLEDIVLFVYSFVYHHLIGLIGSKH